jgi:hypothetical protein
MQLHSLKFDIHSRSLALEEPLSELYVANDLSATFPRHLSTIELHVERKDSRHAHRIEPISTAEGVFSETHLCGAPCFYRAGRFHSAGSGDYWHEMEYDVDSSAITANVAGRYLQTRYDVVTHVMRPILQSFLLPFHNLKSLHGALVSSGDRTLMLTGSGGAGKTTTAIRLALSGWDLLSDDAPLFLFDDGRALALCSLDYAHLTLDTLHLFPELCANIVGEPDLRGKVPVSSRALRSGHEWRKARPVTHVIELKRTNVSSPRLISVDRATATAAMLGEMMVVFRPEVIRADRARFATYSALIFDIISALMRDAAIMRLEFADQHLEDLPALLAGPVLDDC